MKVRLDALLLNAIRRERELTYDAICDRSLGVFQIYHLKYLFNGKTKTLDEDKAVLLAEILGVRLESILANDFVRWATVPADISLTVKRLFLETKEGIAPLFLELLRERMKNAGFQKLLSQALQLREILTRPALEDDHAQKVLLALDCIKNKFAPNVELSSRWMGVDHHRLLGLIEGIKALEPHFTVKSTVFLFSYVLTLFESIFIEELLASAVQLSPDRWRNVTEQYYMVSIPFERLKEAYLELLLNERETLDTRSELPLEIGDAFYSDALLLVMASAAAAEHLEGDLIGSQYVSRKIIHGIQTRLLRTASDVFDLRISVEEPRDRYYSRFGSRYQTFRLLKQATLAGLHDGSKASDSTYNLLVALWVMNQPS